MTRFEKCWIFAVVVIMALGNILTMAELIQKEIEINDICEKKSTEKVTNDMPSMITEKTRQAVSVCVEKEPKVKTQEFTAYAYCACEKCCGKWSKYKKTASGTTPKEGRTVAVDPKIIPLGSKVTINGKQYIAEDTGSGINGNTIDVYFENHKDAIQWGRKTVQVSWE